MFRGEGLWGDRRGGVWGESVPSPIWESDGLPQKFFFKFSQILAIFAHFLSTGCTEEELFTAVKKTRQQQIQKDRGPVFVRLTSRLSTGSIHRLL